MRNRLRMTIEKVAATRKRTRLENHQAEEELRVELRAKFKGKQREAATKLGIKLAYFNDMIWGRRNINDEMLEKLKRL